MARTSRPNNAGLADITNIFQNILCNASNIRILVNTNIFILYSWELHDLLNLINMYSKNEKNL